MHSIISEYGKACERCNIAKLPRFQMRLPMIHPSATKPNIVASEFTLIEKSIDGRENIWSLHTYFQNLSLEIRQQ